LEVTNLPAKLAAIILGIIQGMTEFLPVSSSGHLALAQHLMGISFPGITFEVVVHFGTVLSVIVFFWSDLQGIINTFIRGALALLQRKTIKFTPKERTAWHFGWLIILGSIPTAVLGLFLGSIVEELFNSTRAIGLMLLLTGTLLWWIEGVTSPGGKDIEKMKPLDALFIGLAQGCAIFPGLSRSGSTIAGALLRGLNRETAMRFSFLLSLPAILGATILELKNIALATLDGHIALIDYGIGLLVAFFSGMLAIKLLFTAVKQGKLHYFGYYCWLVGLAAFLVN
jgi:undecaprenyl-diphosphatase